MQVTYHKDLTTFIRKLYFLGKHSILNNSYLENDVYHHKYIDIHLPENSNGYKFLLSTLRFGDNTSPFIGTDNEHYKFLITKPTEDLSIFLTTTKVLDTNYTTPLSSHLERILNETTT